jgi:hypothetical protein
MSGIGSFLERYEFLNLTKSVTESQMSLYKKPNETWSQIGSKLYHITLYNGLSIGAVGADVAVYLAVSTLRSMGLFCPPPPQPPVFPFPQDNAEFIDCAIKRALWDWDLWARKEIEEGIESSFSEKWNVFAVVGEWSLGFSLENMARGSYFKPSFLTISEQLENGASFRSVCTDFAKLWQSEKQAILKALYTQNPLPALGFRARKVYQDIRALASKLHHGNQNYLTAYAEYLKRKSSPASSSTQAPRLNSGMNFQSSAYASVIPSPVFPKVDATSGAPIPSAPPSPTERDLEEEMALDVAFLRRAVSGLPNSPRLRSDILSDETHPSSPASPKTLSARLALLQAFSAENRPSFLPWNQSLENGKTFRQALQDAAALTKSDSLKLQGALVDPRRSRNLSASLKERLKELNEFGRILAKSKDFLKVYEALRIDLLVT